jgi:hypothetical protein
MSIRSLAVGTVLGAMVATAVGIAYAAIPDSNGVVHACYQNVTSANKPVKLLNTSQKTTCPSGWVALSWTQKGTQGPPGPVGSSIVLRARASTITVSPTGGQGQAISLSPDSWTQAANELDMLTGSVTVTDVPYSCQIGGVSGQQATMSIYLVIDGTTLPYPTTLYSSNPGVPKTFSLELTGTEAGTSFGDGVSGAPLMLFEPGSQVTHTLGIVAYDDCDAGAPGGNFTINSVGVDVVAMH